jgi:hypothetical protein
MAAVDPVNKVSKESLLIGKLAVREGYVSEEKVNACLRIQARDGEKRTIGEIMVQKGYLTPAELKTLLSKQQKRIMGCPSASCRSRSSPRPTRRSCRAPAARGRSRRESHRLGPDRRPPRDVDVQSHPSGGRENHPAYDPPGRFGW